MNYRHMGTRFIVTVSSIEALHHTDTATCDLPIIPTLQGTLLRAAGALVLISILSLSCVLIGKPLKLVMCQKYQMLCVCVVWFTVPISDWSSLNKALWLTLI